MNSELGDGQSARFEWAELSPLRMEIRIDPAALPGIRMICDYGWALLTVMPGWYLEWEDQGWVPSATLTVLRITPGQPPSALMQGTFGLIPGNTECGTTGVEIT